MFLYATQKGSFFLEPKKWKYFVVGEAKNIDEIYQLWKNKFFLSYNIKIHDIKDDTVTVEDEKNELKKLRGII